MQKLAARGRLHPLLGACGPCSTTWVAKAILDECCQASGRPTHSPSKEFQTPLTQSPSRVQTQITNSLSRALARFAPQGFWSSGPRAFSHPGFCGLILHIVHYPIPGLYLTPSRIFGFTLHIFSDTTRPSICSYHVHGSILRIFFSFFFFFFFRRLATYLCHVVSPNQ